MTEIKICVPCFQDIDLDIQEGDVIRIVSEVECVEANYMKKPR